MLRRSVGKLKALATALYPKPVDEGALSAFGFTTDDFASDEVVIWHENYISFQVFESLSTQWNIGMSGRTGINYQSIPIVLQMLDVEQEEHKDIFADIRIMEHEVLNQG